MSLYKKILEKLDEAGGYVPVNDKEAKDPRYELAVSVDVKPGEPKRQGAKFGFNLDKAGVPPTMGKKTTGPKSNIAFNLGLVKESRKFVNESNLVLDKSRIRSHIISLIADKIAETDDIDQLSQWLKIIVGKELKPRGDSKYRYIISSDDVTEAQEIAKLKQVCSPEKQHRIKEFTLYCLEELGITKAPRIKLTDDTGTTALGFTDTGDKSITVTVKDRHQMDIMRTLAHELVHYKQLETYMPDGATGSDDENEANALAGVLLRNWGKQNPNLFYEDVMEAWNAKKVLSEKKPCWKGYKQIGMKKKGKKKVPNCVPVDEGFGDWFKNTFSGDPIFRAWYLIYKQDPKAAEEKFPSKHKEFLARVQKETNEAWFGLVDDDPIEMPVWLHPKVKKYWQTINPVDNGIAADRLKVQLKKAEQFYKSDLKQEANKMVIDELRRYKDSVKESVNETATAGATSSGNIASVANPVAAHAKVKRDKNGVPKAPQKTNKNGTAKNALDMSNNLMAEKVIKR